MAINLRVIDNFTLADIVLTAEKAIFHQTFQGRITNLIGFIT